MGNRYAFVCHRCGCEFVGETPSPEKIATLRRALLVGPDTDEPNYCPVVCDSCFTIMSKTPDMAVKSHLRVA